MKHILIALLTSLCVTTYAQNQVVRRQEAKTEARVSTIKSKTSNKPKKNKVAGHSQNHRIIASYSNGVLTVNDVRYEFVRVGSGSFIMGATSEMESPLDDERPTHKVTLTNSYYIGKTEVTKTLWKAVMGNNLVVYPYAHDNEPAYDLSWNDCQKFISKLNAATGKVFRLPTEAEWEFAARGGNNSRHYQYSGSNNINDVAWYENNSHYPHEVATKQPNELGIYDMSGNVWEWCHDWYGSYNSSARTNPKGPTSGERRVQRGGSSSSLARFCRSSQRDSCLPDSRWSFYGFRLCLSE